MAKAAKLKVYRTAIGFHDAYVAAPSQKAALEAWGSDKDLFARAAAEIVTEPALIEEPLAAPGKVIRRLRGTAAEQIAALPPDKPRAADKLGNKAAAAVPRPKLPKSAPPPSRAALEKAEAALDAIFIQQQAALTQFAAREEAFARERKQLLANQKKEKNRLTGERDNAARAYDRAIHDWRDR